MAGDVDREKQRLLQQPLKATQKQMRRSRPEDRFVQTLTRQYILCTRMHPTPIVSVLYADSLAKGGSKNPSIGLC